ncbi:hypothetical protein SUNI508_12405 [Seiridium unicorne]|uniref:Myb-like domain-containing protein n=1 Tax=Seiridium unicorne TaxID=138068 RepID=A0ABR2UE73_9PEZI
MGASDEDDYVPSEVEVDEAGASEHEPEREDSDSEAHNQTQPPWNKRTHSKEAEDEEPSASPASSNSSTSRKRPAHHLQPYAGAPLKRQRRTFNPDYVALLNQDIADASVSLVASDVADLKPSQIGAVRWSSVEKEAFFAALARLGRDDLPGIVARVETKSLLEVRQYLMLLEERTKRRRDDGELRRKTLRPTEIPAAAEVSHECTVALEEAADDLALRQENYEVAAEERRWGDHWLITKAVGEDLHQRSREEKIEEMPFLEFFHLRTWLRLPEQIFMNSVIPDYNWRYVSEEPPAIRATALSDFHALVVSITKRLVASTLFMAGTRIKSQRAYMPSTKDLVKPRDVKAAVESLNMKASSHGFWARAPRRLRLDIMQDKINPNGDGSQEEEAEDESEGEHMMSYDEVEAALGISRAENNVPSRTEDTSSDTDADSEEDSDIPLPRDDELGEETGDDADMDIDGALDREAIKRDMREAMYFSADYEFTTRARQALQGRIEAEHKTELITEEQDNEASRWEEASLWSVLRRTDPPPEIPARNEEAKQWIRTVAYEPAVKNWRDNTQYMSEWEMH